MILGSATGGVLLPNKNNTSVAFGGGGATEPTYVGDMSSGWAQTGSEGADFTIDATDDEVDFLDSYNAKNVYFDTTSVETLSATEWTTRFTYQITGTASGDNPVWWVGMASTSATASNSTATDFTGFGSQTINGSTTLRPYLYMCDDDKLDEPEASDAMTDLVSDNTKYYIEISRDGNTFYVKVYSDSDYSTLIDETSNATPTGTLRYFIIANYIQGSGCTGTFSDFKWWNNATP